MYTEIFSNSKQVFGGSILGISTYSDYNIVNDLLINNLNISGLNWCEGGCVVGITANSDNNVVNISSILNSNISVVGFDGGGVFGIFAHRGVAIQFSRFSGLSYLRT